MTATAGRIMLLRVLQVLPAREVALRVHVSEMTVSNWRAGLWSPSPRARLALEAHFGLPAVLWDLPAVQGPKKVMPRF